VYREVASARKAIGAQDDDFQVRKRPTRVRIYKKFKSQMKHAAGGMNEWL
jgi:hypothetical protein